MENVIIYIMAGFAALGGVDRIFGSRLGLGAEFEKGILTAGQLILTMVGIMVLAPAIADLLIPIISPISFPITSGLISTAPTIFAPCS